MDKKIIISRAVAEELSKKDEQYGREGAAYMMLEMCDINNNSTYE
ncbi:hypothetical protein [Bacillus cereus]